MGELAEDAIEGRACSLCGMYFENPDKPDELYEHGYPVVCRDCWLDLSKSERKQWQRAAVETL